MAQGKSTERPDWAEVLARWRRSGASQRGFCRENDISYSAFTYWHRKLSEHREDSALVRVSSELARNAAFGRGTPIHVQIGGMRAEFSGNERDEAIVRVLRAMRDASCSSI
jgi:hypothetical protein